MHPAATFGAAILGAALSACAAPQAPRAPAAPPPEDWVPDAIGYEVFVRSFQDSDGDGIGDLRGLIDRLDYLRDDLGVDLLWLTPIHPASSYHGYDVTDHRAIDPRYGTLADFDALVRAAHARGMRVILDLVANHTSSEHPWFLESASGAASPRRSWYVWSAEERSWPQPWGGGETWHARGGSRYYAAFSPTMPDLNYRDPAVRAEMIAIAKYWLARGADGFRLDAARFLVEDGPGVQGQADTPETHRFWRELRREVEAVAPGALLLGEVWEDTEIVARYFGTPGTPELHMAFDFESASGILDAIRRGDAGPARAALERRLASWPAWAGAGTFLSNHDQARVGSALARAGSDGGLAAGKLAAAILATWPGTPWIYYGEELGMTSGGDASGDEPKRRPMQWSAGSGVGFTTSEAPWLAPASTTGELSVAREERDPGSLLSAYRRLLRLRSGEEALRRGQTELVPAEGSASLAILRVLEARAILVVYNFSPERSDIVVHLRGPASGEATDAWSGATAHRLAPAPDEGGRPAPVEAWSVPGVEGFGFRIFAWPAPAR